MNQIHFADNIVNLRRSKKITQEQLADFLGITKASVSKWENNQSMPDIMLLPQIATFFDVSIDELIGYETWLSKKQIQKIYQELALEFATKSFAKTLEKSRSLVRKYYSCYSFLLQISILWINHFGYAKSVEEQQKILQDVSALCLHILGNCKEVGICNDAISVKAIADLQMGKAQEVVEALEEKLNPKYLSRQDEVLLIQAYQMLQEPEKAGNYAQISMYLHLLSLLASAHQYMISKIEDLEKCEETMKRIGAVIEAYHVRELHPNMAANFYYHCGLVYARHGKTEAALENLKEYGKEVAFLLEDNHIKLHGDSYFDSLEMWIRELDLGAEPPVNKLLVTENFQQSLEHPFFAELRDNVEFKRIWELKV